MNEPPKKTEARNFDNLEQSQTQETEKPAQEVVKAQPKAKVVQIAEKQTTKPKPVVTYPKGCENYRSLVTEYFGSKADTFLRIARAESGCNPAAVGDTYPINGLYAPSCGLFQIRTLSGRPTCTALKNPRTNVEWAYKIYQSQGFNAWTVCRTKVSCY